MQRPELPPNGRIDPAELDFVRRVRRTIHRHPEVGHHERRTANYVERLLRRMDLKPFRPAPTSIAALVGTAGEKPSVGFRADMDAIPVREATGAPYASRTAGVMHACGHDGHTAALLGLARRLATDAASASWNIGSVLLIFQQAEETCPSGAPIVIDGLPDHLRPAEIFAFHLWPELPKHTIGVRDGTLMASVAGLSFDIHGRVGRPGGTAADAGGTDAIAAAIELYSRLAPGTGRQLDDYAPTAVSLGLINGGDGPNRVATHCRIEGTLRALSWEDQDRAVNAIDSTAKAVEADTRARIDTHVRSGIRPPVRNSAASVRRVRETCARLNIECRSYPARPAGVSEDFGWYLDHAEGAMLLLGCADTDDHPDLHSPRFDFDEEVPLTAVEIFHDLAVRSAPNVPTTAAP